jgi:integrase
MRLQRYRLFQHHGTFYVENVETKKQESLRTKNKPEALVLLAAKNEAARQPSLNLQIARTYLAASDPLMPKRTWQHVLDEIIKTKTGETQYRWTNVAKDKAMIPLLTQKLTETVAEDLFRVMQAGTVSTNVFLRRVHNFALDMNWLPWPVIPKKQWPKYRHAEKRAITWDEHFRIIEREANPERKAFYQLAWHLGASQGDLAHLHAEDIDWEDKVITFERMKLRGRNVGQMPQISFGPEVAMILRSLPSTGPLFPYLMTVRASDRATEFKQRCRGLGIEGITLHSYRYAWAERAKTTGYPERFAQVALGHNSKAVHRAYSRKALVTVPPLEEYERRHRHKKIISVDFKMEETPDLPGTSAAGELQPQAMP